MLEKLDEISHLFNDIERKISDPEVIADQDQYRSLLKKHSELKEIVEIYGQYKKVQTEIAEAKELENIDLTDATISSISITPKTDNTKE